MQVNKLIRKAQTVVDCDGNKKAVQLDYATWEDLLELLEDIEDIGEIDRVREAEDVAQSLKYPAWLAEERVNPLEPVST